MDLSELELKNLIKLLPSIIDCAEWLIEQAEKTFEIGCPDNQDNYRLCSEIFLYNPAWDEYLEAVHRIRLSESYEDAYDSLLNSAHDTIVHGISLSVQMNDLKWFVTPYNAWEKSDYIQALQPITRACHALRCSLQQFKDLYDSISKQWPQFPEDDDEDPTQLPLMPEPLTEHDGYVGILQSITLIQNNCKNSSPKQVEFFQFLTQQLESFGESEEFEEFTFSLVLKENEDLQYLEFYGDGNCISVTDAGYSFDSTVGGDSYTNWEYTIWSNGQDEGSLGLDDDKILEMIQLGAQISIEEPDRFL